MSVRVVEAVRRRAHGFFDVLVERYFSPHILLVFLLHEFLSKVAVVPNLWVSILELSHARDTSLL